MRFGPGEREPLGTAHLRPHVRVLVHELDEELELGTLDRLAYVRTAHMVDDHRRRQRAEEVPQLGQIDRLEVDDHMPVERCDSAGDLDQLIFRREVHEPADEVEAHATHAASMQFL